MKKESVHMGKIDPMESSVLFTSYSEEGDVEPILQVANNGKIKIRLGMTLSDKLSNCEAIMNRGDSNLSYYAQIAILDNIIKFRIEKIILDHCE